MLREGSLCVNDVTLYSIAVINADHPPINVKVYPSAKRSLPRLENYRNYPTDYQYHLCPIPWRTAVVFGPVVGRRRGTAPIAAAVAATFVSGQGGMWPIERIAWMMGQTVEVANLGTVIIN